MAFLTGEIKLNIYTDANQTAFPLQNVPNLDILFSNVAVTGFLPLFLNLAASGSQTVNFNGLTGITEFYLYSDTTALSVQLNGAAAVTYKAAVPGYIPMAANSLTLTNASSSTATNVTLILIKG